MKKRLTCKYILPALLLACTASVLSAGTPAIAEEARQADSAEATVMQLMKTEGDVEVFNSSGRDISVISNMKLYNGYHTETQEASYAWINLDSEKLTKLDAVSEAEIRKKGKKLELLLESGNLFFNVKEDLQDDETLNVRTSTMVMGIRGTSGIVKAIDKWHTQVYILEGTVQCHVTDPVTGQAKNITLTSGESADFYAYPQEQEGDKCDIITKKFTEDDIDGFALVELVQDVPLCEEIQEASDLDVLSLADVAWQRLEESESRMREIMAEIREKEAAQEHHISKDPVWRTENAAADISGGNGINNWGTAEPGSAVTGLPGADDSPGVSADAGLQVNDPSGSDSKWDNDSDRKPGKPGTAEKPEEPEKPAEPEDVNEKARQAYQKILNEYMEASKVNYSDYLADPNNALSRYPDVSRWMMVDYYLGNVSQFYYMYYDVNGDGKDEMIAGLMCGSEIRAAAVYTYDEENDKAVLVSDPNCNYKCFVSIMKNGTIVEDIPALHGYKISADGHSLESVFEYNYDEAGRFYLPKKINAYKNANGLTEIAYNWSSMNVPQNSSERYENPLSALNQEKVEAALRDAFVRFGENTSIRSPQQYIDDTGTTYHIDLDNNQNCFQNLRIQSEGSRVTLVRNQPGLEIPFTVDIVNAVDSNGQTVSCQNVNGYFSVDEIDETDKTFIIWCSFLYQDKQPYLFQGLSAGRYVYISDEVGYVHIGSALQYYLGDYSSDDAGTLMLIEASGDGSTITLRTPRPNAAPYGDGYRLDVVGGTIQATKLNDSGEAEPLEPVLILTLKNGEIILESTGVDSYVDYLCGTYHKSENGNKPEPEPEPIPTVNNTANYKAEAPFDPTEFGLEEDWTTSRPGGSVTFTMDKVNNADLTGLCFYYDFITLQPIVKEGIAEDGSKVNINYETLYISDLQVQGILTVLGNMEVKSGGSVHINLDDYGIIVEGNLVNNGSITSYRSLGHLEVKGVLTNNGTIGCIIEGGN